MLVLRAVAAILILECVALSGAAQQPSEVRIDVNKPTVYLAFDHLGPDDLVWLRLRNNSHWSISFRTENPGTTLMPLRLSDGRLVSGLADNLEVTPEYVIENIPNGDSRYWCTSSESWLAPGLSAIFSLPRVALKPVGRIKINFTYEWEGPGKEPEHRVDFREFELKNALAQISP